MTRQREIKFRAWLKENHSGKHQMFYQSAQYLQSFLRRCAQFSNLDGREHEKYGNYELMQFTGLKDKNGKEIYEGDLLVMNLEKNFKKYHSDLFVMQWNPDTAAWTNYSPREIVEVIGNIYENPELLK